MSIIIPKCSSLLWSLQHSGLFWISFKTLKGWCDADFLKGWSICKARATKFPQDCSRRTFWMEIRWRGLRTPIVYIGWTSLSIASTLIFYNWNDVKLFFGKQEGKNNPFWSILYIWMLVVLERKFTKSKENV